MNTGSKIVPLGHWVISSYNAMLNLANTIMWFLEGAQTSVGTEEVLSSFEKRRYKLEWYDRSTTNATQ